MHRKPLNLCLGLVLALAGCSNENSKLYTDVLLISVKCETVEDLKAYVANNKAYHEANSLEIKLPSDIDSLDLVSIYVTTPVGGVSYKAKPYLGTINRIYLKYKVAYEEVESISLELTPILGTGSETIDCLDKEIYIDHFPRVQYEDVDNDVFRKEPSEILELYKDQSRYLGFLVTFKPNIEETTKSTIRQQTFSDLTSKLVAYSI
jgi:hypothetical protein